MQTLTILGTLVGMIGTAIGIIWLLIMSFRKKDKSKPKIVVAVSVLLMVISFISIPTEANQNAKGSSSSSTTSSEKISKGEPTFSNFELLSTGMTEKEVKDTVGEAKEIKKVSSERIEWHYECYDDSNDLFATPVIIFSDSEKVALINLNKVYDREEVIRNYNKSNTDKIDSEPSSSSGSSEEITEDKSKLDSGDITYLTEEPSVEQKAHLQELAEQMFDEQYPYKGSKMRSIMGVIQNWTVVNERWFYKVEAEIVNGYGATQSTNVEVYITPVDAETGIVEIIDYLE